MPRKPKTVSGQKAKKVTDLVKAGELSPKEGVKELDKLVKKEPALREEIQLLIDEWDIEDKEDLKKYVRSRLIDKSLTSKEDKDQISALKELTKYTNTDNVGSGGRGGQVGVGIKLTPEGAEVLVAAQERRAGKDV